MEWTREQRYRKYKDWDAQTLLDLKLKQQLPRIRCTIISIHFQDY